MRRNFLPASGILASIVLFSFLLLSVGQEPARTKTLYRPTGSEATITGSIAFTGKVPARLRVDTSPDPVCGELSPTLLTENAIVNQGKLANVFVYIKSGAALDFYSFEPPTDSARMSHERCRYEPHLLGVRVGQTVMFSITDPTHHNTHPLTRINPEWNMTQAPGSQPLMKTFKDPEVFIPVKDNHHPWERAFIGVFSHPFFAISDEGGNYQIDGLPPGQYSLVAWHEQFGEQTVDITIQSSEKRKIDFSFTPTSPAP